VVIVKENEKSGGTFQPNSDARHLLTFKALRRAAQHIDRSTRACVFVPWNAGQNRKKVLECERMNQ